MKMVMEQKTVPIVRVHNKNINYNAISKRTVGNNFSKMSMIDRAQLRKMRPGQFDGTCKACGD